jgi:hypothetical protein
MKYVIILIHALIGWGLCGAIMAVGMRYLSIDHTLVIHAIGVPVIFVIISINYFKNFGFTTPLKTGIIFIFFVIFMDVFIVAMFIEKNLDMFKSLMGTWIPFGLIFLATYFTGFILKKGNLAS